MAVALGKRKRGSSIHQAQRKGSFSSSESDSDDVQAIFRKAFEAKFKPLPESTHGVSRRSTQSDEDIEDLDNSSEHGDDNSSWSGFSVAEEEEDKPIIQEVEVISHTTSAAPFDRASKAEHKAFMTSKPPTIPKKSTKSTEADESSDDEASNIKHDKDLQRLLRESHLLSSTTSSAASGSKTLSKALTANGAARHAALDLSMRSLGAKNSTNFQKNMPMSHRKGIAAKKLATEEKRRREAKDTGVVLEKVARLKSNSVKRDRGAGAPAIGRFEGGTLHLSRKDVRSIRDDGDGPPRRERYGSKARGNSKGSGRGGKKR